MVFLASTIILSLVLGAIARPDTFQNPLSIQKSDPCVSGAHIVGVRATTEKPGFGAMQVIADELKDQIQDSDEYAIIYPAAGINITDGKITYNLTEYIDSEMKGYIALKEHLQTYVALCPTSKIVLLGYSQGAHVVGDALCGSYGLLFPHKVPIADFIKKQVRATIQLGDPTNVKGISWHVGNSTHSGAFPRATFKKCGDVTGRWQSYCDAGDPVCEKGLHPKVHLRYVPEYKDDVVQYVVGKVGESSSTSSEFRDYLVKKDAL